MTVLRNKSCLCSLLTEQCNFHAKVREAHQALRYHIMTLEITKFVSLKKPASHFPLQEHGCCNTTQVCHHTYNNPYWRSFLYRVDLSNPKSLAASLLLLFVFLRVCTISEHSPCCSRESPIWGHSVARPRQVRRSWGETTVPVTTTEILSHRFLSWRIFPSQGWVRMIGNTWGSSIWGGVPFRSSN